MHSSTEPLLATGCSGAECGAAAARGDGGACRPRGPEQLPAAALRPGYVKGLILGIINGVILGLALVLFATTLLVLAPASRVAVIRPTNWEGRPIPQLLFDEERQGRNTMLRGSGWEPMDLEPGRGSTKGALLPEATALLVIDMQPLFYHASSPWGSPGGLRASDMDGLWPKQLALAKKLSRFTGRNDSVFLTRYLLPERADEAQGIMRHYYHETADGRMTAGSLRAAGADVDFLLGVMPALQGLVAAGAHVSTKNTAGAFGPSSTLPAQLDSYFAQAGDATRTLIVTGVETDYCVVSSILSAMDRYYRIIVVTDAIGSSQPSSGQAQLDYTLRRFDHMVDFASSASVQGLLA